MNVFNIKNIGKLSDALKEDLSELTKGMIERHIKEYMFEDDGELLIEEGKMETACEELETMHGGLILAGMCAKNELECAFDNESDQFVFWKKEDKE